MRAIRRVGTALAAAALALHAAAVPASAQSDSAIRGLVVAAADGSVLDGCTVTLTSSLTGEAVQRRTEATGWFAFPIVRPGDYRLSVSSDGFTARHLTVSVAPREVRTITVRWRSPRLLSALRSRPRAHRLRVHTRRAQPR